MKAIFTSGNGIEMREFLKIISRYANDYKDSSTRLWMVLAFIAGMTFVLALAQIPVTTIIFNGQPQKYEPALPASPDNTDFSVPGGSTDSIRPETFNNYELVYVPFKTASLSG